MKMTFTYITAFLALALSLAQSLPAQGVPVFVEQCTVATAISAKAIPVPSVDLPGALPGVKSCNLSMNIHIHYAEANIGAAKGLQMMAQVMDGKLFRIVINGTGEKTAKALYKQLCKQAGRASKLVQGPTHYTYAWDFRGKLPCRVSMSRSSDKDKVTAILEPFK